MNKALFIRAISGFAAGLPLVPGSVISFVIMLLYIPNGNLGFFGGTVCRKHINPQWQGGADLVTCYGAEEIKIYLDGQDSVILPVSTDAAVRKTESEDLMFSAGKCIRHMSTYRKMPRTRYSLWEAAVMPMFLSLYTSVKNIGTASLLYGWMLMAILIRLMNLNLHSFMECLCGQ